MFSLTKKEWIVFFAGAEAFHTLSHIMLYYSGLLPMNFYSINVTSSFNLGAILFNGLVTLFLLNWAAQIKR